MKTLITCLLLVIVGSTPVKAQESDVHESLSLNAIRRVQGDFLLQNFSEEGSQSSTVAGIDSLIQKAQQAWAHESVERYGTRIPLVSPIYNFFLAGPSGLNPDRLRHVVVNYQLPAFVREYKKLRQNPTYGSAILLTQERNMFLYPYRYELPKPLWSSLKDIYETMPATLENYLASVEFKEERVRQELAYMRWMLPKQRPLWRILDAVYANKLNQSFAQLRDALRTNANNAGWLTNIGIRLAKKYANQGDAKRGLKVLDFLTRTLNQKVLGRMRDLLTDAYARLDAEHGKSHFQEQLRKREKSDTLSTLKADALLSGTYEDLSSGRAVDLASLRGKVVFIDFWATWCAPCLREIPELKAFAAQHAKRDDFIFISVNGDAVTVGNSKTYVKDFVQEFGIEYTALGDNPENSLTRRFGVSYWPSRFLINEEGKIIMGPDLTHEQVEKYLSNNK